MRYTRYHAVLASFFLVCDPGYSYSSISFLNNFFDYIIGTIKSKFCAFRFFKFKVAAFRAYDLLYSLLKVSPPDVIAAKAVIMLVVLD